MKLAHDFAAARVAAQHCAELVARGPRPEEREAMIGAWRRDLARDLGQMLAPLLGADRLHAEVSAPEWLLGSDVIARIGPVAANSLLRCGAGVSQNASTEVLLSLDHATALALAERSFGGEGRVGEPSLDPLPRSAQLLCDEVAVLVAGALARARLGDGAGAGAEAGGEVIIRSENAARLRAFDPAGKAVLFALQLADAQGIVWRLNLALSAGLLDDLLPAPGAARPSPDPRAGDAAAACFTSIPVALCAVLAEFDLTLGQLDRLAPGDTFPIPMPRSVPLRIGAMLVAHGSIGTLDERMALCLTHLPNQGIAS
jgi:flagellar motor switch protein FliM